MKRVDLFWPTFMVASLEFAPVGRIGNAPDSRLEWIFKLVRFVSAERFRLLPVNEELLILTVTRVVIAERSGNAPVQFMYWLFTLPPKFSVRRLGLLVRVSKPTWLNSLLFKTISTSSVSAP